VAAVGSSPPAAAATSLVTAAAARMSQLWERSVARGSRLDSHIKRRGWSGGSRWSCGGGAGCARRQHSYPHDRVSAGRPNRGRGWRSASSGRTTSSTTRGARVAQCKPRADHKLNKPRAPLHWARWSHLRSVHRTSSGFGGTRADQVVQQLPGNRSGRLGCGTSHGPTVLCICCANDAHGSRRCAAALRAVPRVQTLRFGRLRPSREMDRFKQVSLERPNWRISSGDFRRHLQSHDRAETG